MGNSTLLADASIGLGMAEGAQSLGPERTAARAEARALKAKKDQELRQIQASEPTKDDYAALGEKQSIAIQNALMEQKQLRSQLQERSSYEAIRMYGQDPDVRHLNVMANDLKRAGSTTFADVARFDAITEADRTLMEEAGLDPAFVLADEGLRQNYLKVTKPDGEQEIRSLDEFKAMTRYNQYATQDDLDQQKNRIMLTQVKALGYEPSDIGVEAFRRASAEVGDPNAAGFQDAYTKHYDALRASGYSNRGRGGRSGGGSGGGSRDGSRAENATEAEAEAKRRTVAQGLTEGTPEFDAAFSKNMSTVKTEWSRTSSMRNTEDAELATSELDATGFWEAEPSTDPRERMKYEPLIRRIEKGSDAELTAAQQITLERVNELTMLGDISQEITPEETGLIDRVFRTVSKYISDNTDGVAQESAYAAYRNTVRNALYGSVLTPGENKAFIEQFGDLGQQRGPILAQLRTGLQQVRSNYETLAQLGHPAVIKHRTGMTAIQLTNVLDSIDDRIEMIDNAMSGRNIANPNVNRPAQSTSPEVPAEVLTPEKRSRLDALRTGAPAQGQPQ